MPQRQAPFQKPITRFLLATVALLALAGMETVFGSPFDAALPLSAYLPLALGGGGTGAATATASAEPSQTPLPTVGRTTEPDPSNTPTATSARTPQPDPSPTLTATNTATLTATSTLTSTPTNTPTNTPTPTTVAENQYPSVRGPLAVNPRYRVLTNSTTPVEYLVLLDASGSMSYNYAGEGTVGGTAKVDGDTVGGTNYQCEWNGSNTSTFPYNETCLHSTDGFWHTLQERPIYRAKSMVSTLIDNLGPSDTMRIIPFSGNIQNGYQVLPAGGWTGDHSALRNALRTAGSYQGDPYRTTGGSSNAQGMLGAKRVLSTAPDLAPHGQTYRKVMLVIADGPANIFLDGAINTARDICANYTPSMARNLVQCQIGLTASGIYRPVTATIEQANQIKSTYPASSIYVFSMGAIEDGLKQVASTPSTYYSVSNDAAADALLRSIVPPATQTCSRAGGSQYITTIDAAHAPESLPEGVYGYAMLFDENGIRQLRQVPVIHDPVSGTLSYRFDALPFGNYVLSADVSYRGDDGVTRHYDSLSTDKITFAIHLPLSIIGTSASEVIEPIVYADLGQAVDVCAP